MVNIPCENFTTIEIVVSIELRSLKGYLPGVKKSSW